MEQELMYGLKQHMKGIQFEVVVYKMDKGRYDVTLQETVKYSNDDTHAIEIREGVKKLADANETATEVIDYMRLHEFSPVSYRLCDLSK